MILPLNKHSIIAQDTSIAPTAINVFCLTSSPLAFHSPRHRHCSSPCLNTISDSLSGLYQPRWAFNVTLFNAHRDQHQQHHLNPPLVVSMLSLVASETFRLPRRPPTFHADYEITIVKPRYQCPSIVTPILSLSSKQ